MTDPERRIDLEVEVPGTPEEVWDAIATGPGISAWLHPTEVEEREGGAFTFDMQLGAGPQTGRVTAWDPPRRFVQESTWTPQDPGAGPEVLATEWTIRSHDDGTCTVRLVMTGFGDDEGWEQELDGMRDGMRSALAALRAHLGMRRVPSSSAWAPSIGFSAAVRAGDWVHTAGITAVAADRTVVGGDDADAQAREALRKLLDALAQAGATPGQVVRTRVYLTDAADAEAVGRAHGEVFGAVRPAATFVVVAALLDPRMRVEIEAVAYVGASRPPSEVRP